MAVKYIKSTTGSDSNGGTSWADAYATVAKALSVIAAGDTVYVSQAHAETQGSAMTWLSPGTAGAPVRILCVNDGATPPTALATTATVSTTGAFSITFQQGFSYVYGITFNSGIGSSASSVIFSSAAGQAKNWYLDNCKLVLLNTGAGGVIQLGDASSSQGLIVLNNTSVKFSATGQSMVFRTHKVIWQNTAAAVDVSVATPTTLIKGASISCPQIILSGLDLSNLGSGKNLISVGIASIESLYYIRNCKLGASVSIMTGTIANQGNEEVYLDNCDSGGANYRMEHYKYQGSIKTETTDVMTGGASDGTTSISHKFVSLSTGPTLFSPLQGPWINIWNDTTGSSKTITVEFLHDSLTNLQNSDIYLEVEGLGTSSYPESVYYNNRVADVFATAADCPAGTGTGNWTTTGLTNPNSQNLQVSFTPQIKGPIRARVCLVKSNYTVFVNPVLAVA